jgi:hypothetical protein
MVMALIGFIALLILGCVLTFYAGGIFLLGIGFQDKVGWVGMIPAVSAAAVFYLAFTYAPFTITLS